MIPGVFRTLAGLLSNQGEKSINFYLTVVPLRKSIKVWYCKAQLVYFRQCRKVRICGSTCAVAMAVSVVPVTACAVALINATLKRHESSALDGQHPGLWAARYMPPVQYLRVLSATQDPSP